MSEGGGHVRTRAQGRDGRREAKGGRAGKRRLEGRQCLRRRGRKMEMN